MSHWDWLELLIIRMAFIPVRDYSFSTYALFSEELRFRTPYYAHVRRRIRGKEKLFFLKILRTY